MATAASRRHHERRRLDRHAGAPLTTSESPITRASGEHAARRRRRCSRRTCGAAASVAIREQDAVPREEAEVWVPAPARVLLVVTALAAGAVLLWRWLAP